MMIVTEPELAAFVALTANAIDDAAVNRAEYILGSKLGLILDEEFTTDAFSRQDRYFLAQACLWQAVWMQGHPDLFLRFNSDMMETDGDKMTIKDDGLLYGPLARWALSRTSFMTAVSSMTQTPTEQRREAIDPAEVGWVPWV